ncbi:hypothetical protein B0H14DRAFT_2564451 [Mycena olivaceomarginata]|nr:hypothetical protein B0H14DRAFT_2564451 [Mycena olivaceomarginata]
MTFGSQLGEWTASLTTRSSAHFLRARQDDLAPPAGRCPPGGGNAPPPDEIGQLRRHSARTDGVSVDGGVPVVGSGGDRRPKRLLQKEKRSSNKDHLIAAKEKTTWNSRELSEERRGDKDNGAIPQHILAKKNGDKEKTSRSSKEHHTITAGGAWRYRARGDMVRAKIAAIVMERQVKCELSPRFGVCVHPSSDGQRRGKARAYG